MPKLLHCKWYEEPEDFPEEYTVCFEHPASENFTLCGGTLDQTPDGQPEYTNEPVNCELCLVVVKTIKELSD